ncbi:hypothetical protein BCR35DRAFT_309940 [Leucosporidium creatinivorum]|uniref:Uncharacterized protein n=1 Tax=Leucosporidium creatinivorum TaxID=106004 RepID=A0A1Y2D9X7_9BASI|nr:hypothetical protein BCR35DRAFT_309940 [Leucosporidium creatinivorum]
MTVSCLALARSHAIAAEISTKLSSPRVAGILTPPYSKSTLSLALHVLEPTPKGIVIGPLFSEHADEVIQTFEQVQKELGVEGGVAWCLPPSVLADGGIEGVAKWTREHFESAGIALDETPMTCLPSSLVLGKHREIARDFGATLSDLCTLSGIYVDDFSEAAVSQALHLMHPAPRVMLVGGGFLDDAPKAKALFEHFWQTNPDRKGAEEGTAFVSVDPSIWKEKGKEGVAEHLRKGIKKGLSL